MKSEIIISFIVAVTLIISAINNESVHSNQYPVQQSLNVCPVDNELTRGNVELFISDPSWSENRAATGTNDLSLSQLQILTDNQDIPACQYFNSEFEETINQTWTGDVGSKYHVVYYKAGNFYFVSIVIAKPTNPKYAALGLSFLIIFDNNFNEIKGYSF